MANSHGHRASEVGLIALANYRTTGRSSEMTKRTEKFLCFTVSRKL
jgi:hypothetical protein